MADRDDVRIDDGEALDESTIDASEELRELVAEARREPGPTTGPTGDAALDESTIDASQELRDLVAEARREADLEQVVDSAPPPPTPTPPPPPPPPPNPTATGPTPAMDRPDVTAREGWAAPAMSPAAAPARWQPAGRISANSGVRSPEASIGDASTVTPSRRPLIVAVAVALLLFCVVVILLVTAGGNDDAPPVSVPGTGAVDDTTEATIVEDGP